MTDQQAKLLSRLFQAHRHAWIEDDRNYGYEEVGWINGVNPRTARALCNLGLAMEQSPPRENLPENSFHIRLPLPLPHEDEADFRRIDDWIRSVSNAQSR